MPLTILAWIEAGKPGPKQMAGNQVAWLTKVSLGWWRNANTAWPESQHAAVDTMQPAQYSFILEVIVLTKKKKKNDAHQINLLKYEVGQEMGLTKKSKKQESEKEI